MEPDFGGYATKAGIRCSDGRVIKAEAFKHMDGVTVPLVYQHGHSDIDNVLGHVLLEARHDGMYAYGFFNETPNGKKGKVAVEHGDLNKLSIWANQLKEQNKVVSHGSIKETSLVLAGANPGATIDYVRIQHGDGPDEFTELDDEAIIHSGLELEFLIEEEVVEHAEGDGVTVQEVYDSLNEQQKSVVHFIVGAALEEQEAEAAKAPAAEHSDNNDQVLAHSDEAETNDEGDIAHQEGNDMSGRNVFDQADASGQGEKHVISHSDIKAIFADGVKRGSFKEAAESYVLQHGIDNVELLFPDAKAITNTPEFDKRRTEWVSGVLGSVRKTPFSRIKTLVADITQDQARAKGYIKGSYKTQEWFGVTKRTTGPTTVYKKQQMDRDDILDVTDFDVVAWLMTEMRLMLEEELARAILVGDGRTEEDVDKIKDPWGAANGDGIRSILNDHEYYVTTLTVNVADANSNYEEVVDAVMDGREFYKGTGSPTFYTTVRQLNKFLKAKDGEQRRYYRNAEEVAVALGVDRVVTVEPMNEIAGLIGIIVNLGDYNLGLDRGGEITSFSDFDIDYNQNKYLLETRLSGALTRIKSALVIKETAATNLLATPLKPSFVKSTGVVTIPTVTGVVYKDEDNVTISSGAMTALAAGASVTIYSVPASGYYFASTAEDSWPFTRPAGA